MGRSPSTGAVAAAMLLVAAGCNPDNPSGPTERPARVEIARAFPSLFEQDTTLLIATAFRSDNSVIPNSTITWASDAKAIATVVGIGSGGSNGLITSVRPGKATITATVNGVAGSAVVAVLTRALRPNREISFLGDTTTASRSNFNRVRTINLDGTGLRTITPNLQAVGSYTWSPNGDRIAVSYLGAISGTLTGLFVLNADGTAPRQLDTWTGDQLRWSPDGDYIASWRGTSAGPQVFIHPVAGGPAIQFTRDGENVSPEWSPDSRQIAYSHDLPTTAQLWIGAADGSVSARHIPLPVKAFDVRWSPDGKHLTFRAPPYSIWVVDADGGHPHPVAGACTPDGRCAPGQIMWYPAWSRDGQTVMYPRSNNGPYYNATERVTIDGKVTTPIRGEGCCVGAPLASPDGAWLLQGSIMPGPVQWPGAAVMRADGSNWRFITPAVNAGDAQWRP